MFEYDGERIGFNIPCDCPECTEDADGTWYNEGIEPDANGEDDMAHMKNLEQVEGLEPITSRKTHPWGTVDLYTPQTEPAQWGEYDWIIVTERSSDGPIYAEVPADKAWEYFERPWSIPKRLHK